MLALRRVSAFLVASAALTAASVASAQGSPFAPGGPLAPWTGPLPSPVEVAPATPTSTTPASNAPPGSTAPNYEEPRQTPLSALGFAPFPRRQPDAPPGTSPDSTWQPASTAPPPPAADTSWKSTTDSDDDRQTYVAAMVNPALMTFGKTSGRLEIAPLAAHAVFVEVSRLSLFVDEVSRTVTGTEIDVGYHLFPQGKGAYGFYIGPRYMFGSGEIPEATWEFQGVGGDLGYQWIIANHLVFNLGAGIARVEGKAEIDDGLASGLLDGVPEEEADAFRSLSTQSQSLWVPMLTLGFGLAI